VSACTYLSKWTTVLNACWNSPNNILPFSASSDRAMEMLTSVDIATLRHWFRIISRQIIQIISTNSGPASRGIDCRCGLFSGKTKQWLELRGAAIMLRNFNELPALRETAPREA
jgi:hypothetical protein